MALRVLLADESSTIKKVISLALQDFAAEVKVVHSGVDVVEVAKQFGPDIIFADILLQKKNGYEVCYDLKSDQLLAKIPVVLMWSSFMDLDEKSYKMSKANAKLEKPFEVEDLRKLVSSLVQKKLDHQAASFLKFPKIGGESAPPPPQKNKQKTETAEPQESSLSRLGITSAPPKASSGAPPPPPPRQAKPASIPPPTAKAADPKSWNMDSFEDIQIFTDDDDETNETKSGNSASDLNRSIESFSEVRLTPPPIEDTDVMNYNLGEHSEPWEQKDLSNFKIDVSDEADPFALMDLNKPESTSTKLRQATPAREVGKVESFQTFDFSDNEDLDLELESNEEQTKPMITSPPSGQESGLGSGLGSGLDGGDWNFKLPEHEVSPIQENEVELPPEYAAEYALENLEDKSDLSQLAEAALEEPPPPKVNLEVTKTQSKSTMPTIDQATIEKIVIEQTRQLVEKLVQRILPDMAKQMIQKELDRLLNEENLP